MMKICVFGASASVEDKYVTAVEELGFELGKAGCSLVFGGYANGLMEAAADGFDRGIKAYESDCEKLPEIIGVVPACFDDERTIHPACTRIIRTADLAERKRVMIAEADAFLAVPGGIGTLDELFEVMALKQIGELEKPIAVFGPYGFYDGLDQWLAKLAGESVISVKLEEVYRSFETREEVAGFFRQMAF